MWNNRRQLVAFNKTGNARKRNTEERSLNKRCRGKAVRVTYSAYVCL